MRWLLLPILMVHGQLILLWLPWHPEPMRWWIILETWAIAWFIWTCRTTPVAALLLAYFALIYCGLPALALMYGLPFLLFE